MLTKSANKKLSRTANNATPRPTNLFIERVVLSDSGLSGVVGKTIYLFFIHKF